MTAAAIWRRLILSVALVVCASFLGVFVLGGGRGQAAPKQGSNSASASLTSHEAQTADAALAAGRTLFVENCSSCHGIGAAGGSRAPNLRGLGSATVDLWLSAGWMPLAEPTAEPQPKPAKFDRSQVLEIVKYVTSLAPSFGNPSIPYSLNISHANVAEGFSLFALNCAPCHTITGAGDALADGIYAPPLHGVTKTMVWEAIRTGPGNMPRFGPGTISPAQVVDVVGYVVKQIQHPKSPGGLSLGGVGPVAEGFVGLFVGVGLCMLAALWIGDRAEKDEEEDHGGHGDDHEESQHGELAHA